MCMIGRRRDRFDGVLIGLFGETVSVTKYFDYFWWDKRMGLVSSIRDGKKWVLSGISRLYIGGFGFHFVIVFHRLIVDVFGDGRLVYWWPCLVRRFGWFLLLRLVLCCKVSVGWRCIGDVSSALIRLCWDGRPGVRN